MWQNQLLRNSLGRVCPYLGKQDKTRGAGTCRERDSHTRVPRGTALPPRSDGCWSWRYTHLGRGVSTQARKTSNNNKIIHTRLCWVGLFICMRYKYPCSKGRLLFKMIPVYRWKGEPSLMVRKGLFPRALPWAQARDLLYGKGTRAGYILRHKWDSLILSQLVETEISQSTVQQ